MIDPPHAVVLLLGAIGTIGAIRAQEKPRLEPAQLLERARGLLGKGDVGKGYKEQATRLLWQAQCILATATDKSKKLKRTIDSLAAETDPHN